MKTKLISATAGLVVGMAFYTLLRDSDPNDSTKTNAPLSILCGSMAIVVVSDEIKRRLRK